MPYKRGHYKYATDSWQERAIPIGPDWARSALLTPSLLMTIIGKITRLLAVSSALFSAALLWATGVAGETKTIALLLPLSGEKAELGDRLYSAAEQAFFDFAEEDDLRLVPVDSNSKTGLAAAEPDIVVGPVYSSGLRRLAKELDAMGNPPLLALGFDPDLADGGRNRYLLGVSVIDEVTPPIAHACSRGIRRFALLTADTTYGNLAAEAAARAITECQGKVVKWGKYKLPLTAAGAINVTTAMTAGFIRPTAAEKSFFSRGLPMRRQPFEALVIPGADSKPDDLVTLASLLPYTDKPLLQLLGGRIFADPVFAGEPFLLGGWFSRAVGGDSFLAAATYDAMALAINSCRKVCGNAEYLTSAAGFSGKSGLFRLRRDGSNQRMLAVAEITEQGNRVLAEPPRTFPVE